VEFCEDRISLREAEVSPLLEPAARERLMTQQAGKGLVGSVVISSGAVIPCTYESCVSGQ
jgi:hypothetical protein